MSRGRLSEVVQKGSDFSGTFAERCARTGPQKKCAGMFLTGDVVAVAEVDVREVHEARERAEVA